MSWRVVSLLGCGWLGLPLAQKLTSLGITVQGSTTTPSKTDTLRQAGIIPYLIHCHPEIKGKNITDFFDADVLFLNIPFKRDQKDPFVYKAQIQSVIQQVENSRIDFVIFTSSTSVYPETNEVVKEDLCFEPANERAEVLCQIENLLLHQKSFSSTILRLAGLYGGERKIGNFLAGQQRLPDPESPVNLVHRDDCLAIVARIIQEDIRGEIFNVCSDGHPTRKYLYTQAARQLGIAPPQFLSTSQGPFKIVSNEKVKKRLGYEFLHPDPSRSIS